MFTTTILNGFVLLEVTLAYLNLNYFISSTYAENILVIIKLGIVYENFQAREILIKSK